MSENSASNIDTHDGTRPAEVSEARTWRPLRFFNFYRFALAGLFVTLYYMGPLPLPLGHDSPQLFFQASLVLLIFSSVAMVMIAKRTPDFLLQLHMGVLVDIILIIVMMHASGGINSGVGVLLVISVANGSMIAGGRGAGLMAAFATIAILLEQVNVVVNQPGADFNFTLAGMLGAALFATAILTSVLARRARESEALATQRGVDLANMATMTDYVIQQMTTGVLVIDADYTVRLMNQSARRLLGVPEKSNYQLAGVSPELLEQLRNWQQNRFFRPTILELSSADDEILPRFKGIGGDVGTLVFLEDATLASRQAQQLKVASLGRLTAGIAHEVRNPLGAISHAGELLAESPNLDKQDIRLTEIIREQSRRVNNIIDSVLQLGRRDRTQPVEISLEPWLEQLVSELAAQRGFSDEVIAYRVIPADLKIDFDVDQLRQVVTNLVENGLRHAEDSQHQPRVKLEAGNEGERVYLDIIDFGPGVSDEELPKIFEPFYTTSSKGTGLGLYLCRELAGANRAQLAYRRTDEGHSRFRLLFAISADVTP
jgi:two-component system sensor histidine kinase PilS (NtrC family)